MQQQQQQQPEQQNAGDNAAATNVQMLQQPAAAISTPTTAIDITAATAMLHISGTTKNSTSLANDMRRRITAPLTRANLKRYRAAYKLKTLTTDQQSSMASLVGGGSSSNGDIYTSSEASSLYGGGGVNETHFPWNGIGNEQRQLINGSKRTQKKLKPATTASIEAAAETPQQIAIITTSPSPPSLAVRRRRKRERITHFLRRSTSRFSSKSAPG